MKEYNLIKSWNANLSTKINMSKEKRFNSGKHSNKPNTDTNIIQSLIYNNHLATLNNITSKNYFCKLQSSNKPNKEVSIDISNKQFDRMTNGNYYIQTEGNVIMNNKTNFSLKTPTVHNKSNSNKLNSYNNNNNSSLISSSNKGFYYQTTSGNFNKNTNSSLKNLNNSNQNLQNQQNQIISNKNCLKYPFSSENRIENNKHNSMKNKISNKIPENTFIQDLKYNMGLKTKSQNIVSNISLATNMIGDYILDKTIGSGTFGQVKVGIHGLTGEKVAVKILEKSKLTQKEDLNRIRREMKILSSLSHQNLVQTYEILENTNSFFIIMEYVKGGELFNLIVEKRRLTDAEASFFFFQLISGLEEIHKLDIAHRDLKPENLIFTENKILKIIDFGLSNNCKDLGRLETPCGSPCYASPEMILGDDYEGKVIDLWSVGIILYAMVCGYLPFEEKTNDLLFKKICECKFVFPSYVSSTARDMINKFLITNPNERIRIHDVKKHSFFLQGKRLYENHLNNFYKDILISLNENFGEGISKNMIVNNSELIRDNHCNQINNNNNNNNNKSTSYDFNELSNKFESVFLCNIKDFATKTVEKIVLEVLNSNFNFSVEEICNSVNNKRKNKLSTSYHLLFNKIINEKNLLENLVLIEVENLISMGKLDEKKVYDQIDSTCLNDENNQLFDEEKIRVKNVLKENYPNNTLNTQKQDNKTIVAPDNNNNLNKFNNSLMNNQLNNNFETTNSNKQNYEVNNISSNDKIQININLNNKVNCINLNIKNPSSNNVNVGCINYVVTNKDDLNSNNSNLIRENNQNITNENEKYVKINKTNKSQLENNNNQQIIDRSQYTEENNKNYNRDNYFSSDTEDRPVEKKKTHNNDNNEKVLSLENNFKETQKIRIKKNETINNSRKFTEENLKQIIQKLGLSTSKLNKNELNISNNNNYSSNFANTEQQRHENKISVSSNNKIKPGIFSSDKLNYNIYNGDKKIFDNIIVNKLKQNDIGKEMKELKESNISNNININNNNEFNIKKENKIEKFINETSLSNQILVTEPNQIKDDKQDKAKNYFNNTVIDGYSKYKNNTLKINELDSPEKNSKNKFSSEFKTNHTKIEADTNSFKHYLNTVSHDERINTTNQDNSSKLLLNTLNSGVDSNYSNKKSTIFNNMNSNSNYKFTYNTEVSLSTLEENKKIQQFKQNTVNSNSTNKSSLIKSGINSSSLKDSFANKVSSLVHDKHDKNKSQNFKSTNTSVTMQNHKSNTTATNTSSCISSINNLFNLKNSSLRKSSNKNYGTSIQEKQSSKYQYNYSTDFSSVKNKQNFCHDSKLNSINNFNCADALNHDKKKTFNSLKSLVNYSNASIVADCSKDNELNLNLNLNLKQSFQNSEKIIQHHNAKNTTSINKDQKKNHSIREYESNDIQPSKFNISDKNKKEFKKENNIIYNYLNTDNKFVQNKILSINKNTYNSIQNNSNKSSNAENLINKINNQNDVIASNLNKPRTNVVDNYSLNTLSSVEKGNISSNQRINGNLSLNNNSNFLNISKLGVKDSLSSEAYQRSVLIGKNHNSNQSQSIALTESSKDNNLEEMKNKIYEKSSSIVKNSLNKSTNCSSKINCQLSYKGNSLKGSKNNASYLAMDKVFKDFTSRKGENLDKSKKNKPLSNNFDIKRSVNTKHIMDHLDILFKKNKQKNN